MKKTTLFTVALALTSAIAMAQDKPAAPAPAAPAPAPATAQAGSDPVIISAGNISIRQSEFEGALKSLPPEYQQFAMTNGKKQFAEDYLRMKMLAAEGMKNGLQNDPDVQSQLALMRENLIANAQVQRLEKSITISDDDLKKAYEANKAQYEQVKASHILIAFKGSPAAQPGKPELTDEQAKAKAEDLRKQIVAGANFEELAKKESDDVGSGSRGGELGSFGRGQMVPEFEAAAFDAKPGDITPVVKTQYGYHIIKVESHDYTAFEGVKATLERAERQKRLQAAIDSLKSANPAKLDEKYFAPPAAPATSEGAAPAEGGAAAAAANASADAKPAAPKSKYPVNPDAKKDATKGKKP